MDDQLSKISLGELHELEKLDSGSCGTDIKVRGFVFRFSCTGKYIFIILRDGSCTLQCVASKPHSDSVSGLTLQEFNKLKKTTLESYAEFEGRVFKSDVEISGCIIKDIELHVSGYSILSLANENLPFSMKDVSATMKEREKNPALPTVAYHICLDNRSMDLRTLHSRAIFRIVDGVMFFFRDYLRKKGFVEIKSPKLIGSSSEGGASVFRVDYFWQKAFLAQSPQLYKQMAIIGGMKRVYEVGHVYRAEESNINRYLSEFVGLDIEMEVVKDHDELIMFVHLLLVKIFDGLKKEYLSEMERIREFRHFEDIKYNRTPVVLTHRACVDLLLAEGIPAKYDEDFNSENEKTLGEIVKRSYGVDIFVIKDFPALVRPFYTCRNKTDDTTRSYDFILRGEEILSGAQRTSEHEDLIKEIERRGISIASLGGYIEAFKYGVPPHGGCGIGLERTLKAYFGMNDIRYLSLFPREPNRLYP